MARTCPCLSLPRHFHNYSFVNILLHSSKTTNHYSHNPQRSLFISRRCRLDNAALPCTTTNSRECCCAGKFLFCRGTSPPRTQTCGTLRSQMQVRADPLRQAVPPLQTRHRL
ncbi:hypothetical protein K443DRAFT_471178 [Laccaria amethystina LaAM-08-1]|uniref:Uncharacterized protein n=1 Tax=Laccaria amethystina LaAM-08-1 TaxID=1095629 RepID=A0A0C9WN90_9AGAR|nr:hypothetical protein K443DRAFT_471178 [Laccaria amethystina LaAM-08-1]